MIKKIILTLTCIISFAIIHSQGLPEWPLVNAAPQFLVFPLATVPNQTIDWTVGSPVSSTIPGTGSNKTAPAQAGINGCNQMMFYVLHNGDFNQATSFLRIFTPTGIYVPLPGGDMNANAGDDEVQVIRRPGVANQWFVVYNLAPAAPFPGGNPGYECSNLGYSLIEVNGSGAGTTANYVSDGLGPIQNRILQVGGISRTYIQGKASSMTSVVVGYNHDIYTHRRAQGSSTFIIDRFSVNGTTNIVHTGSSTAVVGYWWSLLAAGSPIELYEDPAFPANNRMAVMARSDVDAQQRIYIYDISTSASLGTAPQIITLDELEVQFTAPPSPLVGLSHQPQDFQPSPGSSFDWLRNFERKINGCEFSPNGQFLYITGGGYVASSTTNISYLGQIDLNTLIAGNHPVRLQVETSDPGNSYSGTTGAGPTYSAPTYAALWDYHQLSNIESCYNGNFYFTKGNSETLFVLPNPNGLLPINMLPHSVDFGTVLNPNIPTVGYVAYLPDQIDKYDYSLTNFTIVSMIVSNQMLCSCDTLTIWVQDSAGNNLGGFLIEDCPDTFEICVPSTGTFTLMGSNGVSFPGAIVNGSVVYPGTSGLFSFGSSSGSGGSAFTIINSTNNYINTDAVFDGKYFIEDGIILTIDGAILDITNVDLVFGDCAGIDFINGAHLRANNSVLRPCQIDGTWRGLQFTSAGNFDNIINECTFKNAEIALYFNGNVDGVVSNNLFSNCNHGIRAASSSNFNHPISGNRFVVDDFFPTYHNCYPFTSPVTTYGVFMTSCRMRSEISHNEFIYSKEAGPVGPLSSIGIGFFRTGGNMSENTFTNFRNPIIISDPSLTSYIDNNEIEYNNDFLPSLIPNPTAGISIYSNKSIVEITNNEIHDNSGNIISYGIYVTASSRVSARKNEIDGFDVGLFFYRDNSIEITENIVTNVTVDGIRFEDLNRVNKNYITCNEVTMKPFTGTGIHVLSANQNTFIYSNCISDSRNALTVEALLGSGHTIPVIRNNYLYNYSNGISNVGHSGNIGTSADPGLNTLWSNNNSAVDIASTTSITVANNFGMFNISFPQVAISQNNPYHSTASCGHQIFNMPSQGNLNQTFVCDNTSIVYFPVTVISSEARLGDVTLQDAIAASNEPLMDMIRFIESISELDEVEFSNVINGAFTDNNSKNLAFAYLNLRTGNYELAQQYFIAYSPIDDEGNTLKFLQLTVVDVLLNPGINIDDKIDALNLLAEEKGPMADIAASLLRFTSTHADYPYAVVEPFNDISTDVVHISDNSVQIEVFPNPAENIITIQIVTDQDVSNFDLSIQDMTGKNIANYPVQFVTGRLQIDISSLSSGIYILQLHNDQFSQSVKLIKE